METPQKETNQFNVQIGDILEAPVSYGYVIKIDIEYLVLDVKHMGVSVRYFHKTHGDLRAKNYNWEYQTVNSNLSNGNWKIYKIKK